MRRFRRLIVTAVLVLGSAGTAQAQAPQPRPGALVPLYAAFATAEALDIHSTHLALAGGAREANGVIAPCVQSLPCIVGVKAAAASAVILIIDRAVRPKHRRAAGIFAACLTAAQFTVDVHNYRVARR